MMLGELFAAIAAVVLLLAGVVLQPSSSSGRCPAGWSLGEGVRRTGEFACYSPPPHDCGEPRGPNERPCPTPVKARGRIHCTGGSVPIVVDERTVGCQMPH
jgi:hypothetical protein